VSDIFKTPGKLRGKTPRTARKRNALGNRAVRTDPIPALHNNTNPQQPLTDIFAPNTQTAPSPTKTQFYKQIAQIQVAEDAANVGNRPASAAGPSKTYAARGKENTDSGYHGITDDEMESAPAFQPLGSHYSSQKPAAQHAPTVAQPTSAAATEERRVTEDSFVSAKENLASRNPSQEDLRKEQEAAAQKLEAAKAAEQPIPGPKTQATPSIPTPKPAARLAEREPAEDNVDVDLDRMDEEDVRSPSEGSSPVKPLVRKSSLTFASLPAREPLASKKSIGARTSHVDQYKGPLGASRSSNMGRFTGGKSLGGQQHIASSATHVDDDPMDLDAVGKPVLSREESETTKMHHQTTTQRLHDRINMLGQSRSSKSNPFGSSNAQPVYPQLPQPQPENEPVRPTTARALPERSSVPLDVEEADDEDWIVPTAAATTQEKVARPLLLKTRTADQLPSDATVGDSNAAKQQGRFSPSKFTFGHKKVMSASAISSPTRSEMAPDARQQKPISVSNPPVQYNTGTHTPAGSPRRTLGDGPLSATKAKLYSALRSAKGIFASSAGVSAQAKMEALSSPVQRPKEHRQHDPLASPTMEHAPGPALYPNVGDASRVTSAESATSNSTEGRRTRSSSEREQKKKDEMRKAAGDLEKAREKERQKAATAASKLQKSPSKDRMAQRPNAPSRTESERSQETNNYSTDEMPPPPPPKSMLPTTQAQRMREPRRIAKPMKDAPSKMRPAPVTVRMPSQRIGQPQQQPSTASLSQSLQDTLPPPVPPKPTVTSKASSNSLHASSSTTSLKSSGSSQAAKKALEAAAKKREADVKAAQRKADQKREIEQRRAAKQEEDRRREEEERRKQTEERRRLEDERRAEQQKRITEQQRREEAKRLAQRQAAEAKRAEQQRKENPRSQQNDFAHAMQQEKAQGPYGHPRADLGGARPMSRMNLVQDPSRPPIQMNPAKPPKRALPADTDEQQARPAAQRNPPSYQQLDAKRRKTNEHDDEDELVDARRSVMAPPVRQSNIRKVCTVSQAPTASTYANRTRKITSSLTAMLPRPLLLTLPLPCMSRQ
jgi:hypothetical protein